MSLLSNIVGFSLFGLAARFGQLGIQKRSLISSTFTSQHSQLIADCTLQDPLGHIAAMGTFGFIGYWVHQWDERAAVLLAEKRAQITERRQRQMVKAAAEEVSE